MTTLRHPWSGPLALPILMEPGSLVMERKMLMGIKSRAERLARERRQVSPLPPAEPAAIPA